jgi:hypothetical protein
VDDVELEELEDEELEVDGPDVVAKYAPIPARTINKITTIAIVALPIAIRLPFNGRKSRRKF